MCLFQKYLYLPFCFLPLAAFSHHCIHVCTRGSGLGSIRLFYISLFFFSSEMVKCLPNAKPAPKAQLVCSKAGGIESCFLSCPSNTLFVPGLYKVFVLLRLGCDLVIFSLLMYSWFLHSFFMYNSKWAKHHCKSNQEDLIVNYTWEVWSFIV